MLNSYQAQLQGDQVIWLGTPPPVRAEPRRIVVVLDDAANENSTDTVSQIFNRARGSLGRRGRESILNELAASRKDWER